MDSVPSRVTLVVKASNQQFEDQTVVCEPAWTVKQLKEHLYEVYPSKPNVDEQKLIYAGQLLTDKLILKDILRTYEGVHPPNHTMHLVYTPKTRQQLNTSTTAKVKTNITRNDGLRFRSTHGSSSTNDSLRTVHNPIPQISLNAANNCPNSLSSSGSNVPGFSLQNNTNEYLMAQQLAMQNWMQQAYVQYMNQYMNLLSNGVRPETVYMQNQHNSSVANNLVPQMPYLPQNFPFSNTSPPNLPNNPIPANAVVGNPHGTDQGTQAVAIAPPEQPHQPENEQPQPRFPNIVQEELPENRDWLDMFYSFSRLLVLLTLVYFYSSPLRCLAVLLIGLTIYMYHIGIFRNAGEANNNNNAGGRENNAHRQQAPAQEPENPVQLNNNQNNEQENQQTAVESATTEGEGSAAPSNPIPEAQNNGTSVIAFIRTFVVSFIVSLLPETPAL